MLADAMTAHQKRTSPEDQPDDDENTGNAADPRISAGYMSRAE